MDYPFGLDPFTCRQHLLHHHYSPLVSVHASHHCDVLLQRVLGVSSVSVLQVLRPYGNNAKYSVPRQNYKIVNNQLITKSYHSFPVRFGPPANELIDLQKHQGSQQLFSLTQLEMLLNQAAHDGDTNDLYLKLFDKVVSTHKVVPFETFNHPVAQVFFVEYGNDTLESLRQALVEFRNYAFPKYFQLDDVLMHVFVVYDPQTVSSASVHQFQQEIKSRLSLVSTALPVDASDDEPTPLSPDQPSIRPRSGTANSMASTGSATAKFLKVPLYDGSTITEDLQRLSLGDSQGPEFIQVPKRFDRTLRTTLHEFLSKYVIAHMQSKTRQWDDVYLQPKRSITSRFFSASKRMFSGSREGTPEPTTSSGQYNSHDQYYHRSSPEQIIRKLADWSLALKDFKYAYSTYDLIKKDYTTDKAWSYVASTQAMCCISLLLSHTVSSAPATPHDRNTLRKIRHDIIEPYIDSCLYTLKSRLGLKTFALRTLVVVVELLLCFGVAANLSGWWSELIQRYLVLCINDVDGHLAANNYNSSTVVRALIYERAAYSLGRCIFLSDLNVISFNELIIKNVSHQVPATITDHSNIKRITSNDEPAEFEAQADGQASEDGDDPGYYVNHAKVNPANNAAIAGKTRYRQSALWYLLAVREWLNMKAYTHVDTVFNNIKLVYDVSTIDPERWYDRADLLLGFAKRSVEEYCDGREHRVSAS
ncbi:hypothetical protein DIURU_000618 [Diutina rugosa]|uniref:Trafficking protein particle complex III-specific subunit 85 n=1 Tax=Diutina rugosa TaxID=5481 RepID=A0A642UXP6_DIURU|nr:uncharacterized protein DIURU_000618 [Diutina rugosa]KAA8907298.1 hypothetical protein DIURU_000618 [Diutina rugosa]